MLSGALQVEWLAGELARLAPNRSYAEALRHAQAIRGAWMAWYWRYDVVGHVIEGEGTRLYARRVEVKDGPGTELKRLLRAADRGTPEDYSRQWEGTSGRTQRLVLRAWTAMPPEDWPELDDDGRLHTARADFTAAHNYLGIEGHVSLRPLQCEAVPMIEAALGEHQAIPAGERRKRKLDLLADDLVDVTVKAYTELTGKSGFFWNHYTERYEGGLIKLVSVIEMQWDFEACCDGRGHRRPSAFTVRRLQRFLGYVA